MNFTSVEIIDIKIIPVEDMLLIQIGGILLQNQTNKYNLER